MKPEYSWISLVLDIMHIMYEGFREEKLLSDPAGAVEQLDKGASYALSSASLCSDYKMFQWVWQCTARSEMMRKRVFKIMCCLCGMDPGTTLFCDE